MKLERFKERDHKKIGVIVFTLVCLFLISGAVLYRTFAIFEVKTNQNVIKGKVGDTGDLEFAFYIDDKIVKESPKVTEKEKYTFDEESSSCTNGATVYWDYQRWGPNVSNLNDTKTKCYLKFKTEYSEPILNGAVPKLEGDLTPVKIDENGTVRKADIKEEWYRYGSQQWANAVITGNSYELLGSNVYGATKEDGYVHLDGQDDYIDLGLANYDFKDGITLTVNFSVTQMPETLPYAIIGNWSSTGNGLWIEASELKLFYDIYSSEVKTFGGYQLNLNEDYLVVATYDNKNVKIYVNNVLISTVPESSSLLSSIESYAIGCDPDGENGHSYGAINVKQAAIFNRAIDENEVADISNNFKITNGEGLLKYVDFTNKTYEAGEVISEDNIESYFVWIPRYRYLLWNGEEETSKFTSVVENLGVITDATKEAKLNQQQPIRIEFESKSMPISNSTEKGEYLTHPAFTSFDSNGFWVGKFETGYKGATSTKEAEQDEKDVSKIIVKPNVYSWRNINLVNSFDNSKEYKQNLDSHMMKNMEWGAVAYLTNSKYGRCPNGKCEEVIINNSGSCVTGSSSSIEPKIGYDAYHDYESNKPGEDTTNVKNYNNKASNLSSTTNNYYGIFDIVGGAWERVMGVMNDQNGSSFINQAGFTSVPEAKYYDVYEYSSVDYDFNLGLFGDGTKEIGPFYKGTYGIGDRQLGSWYAGEATFISKNYPLFERGGSYADGSNASIFAFFVAGYGVHEKIGFRIVLTP